MPLLKLAEHYFYILSRFFRVDSFFRPFRFALCHSSLYQKVKVEYISEKVGYSTGFALSKAFKRIYGISPQHFRQQAVSSLFKD
ncbi:AraC family transcriptional regulator [Chloroflexi bacterium TSY]|nr:AraC family transcriptional regulator [Chloroflexi bacterium TSY]